MRHPAYHYVRYMLITGQVSHGADTDVWARILGKGGLGPITEEEVESARVSATLPPGARVRPLPTRGKLAVSDALWLRGAGVYDLCYPDAAMRRVLSLLSSGALRQRAEELLVCQMSPREVAHHLSAVDSTITESVIQSFAHYFWDVSRMSHSCWHTYLRACPRWSALRYRLLSDMLVGRSAALFRLQKSPMPDVQECFKELMGIAMAGAREVAALPPSAEKAVQLGTYVRSALRLGQELSKSDQAAIAVQEKFNAFETVADAPPPLALSERIGDGGSVSTDAAGALRRQRSETGGAPIRPPPPPPPPTPAGTKPPTTKGAQRPASR